MTNQQACRVCGAKTVSSGNAPLCFSCQIERTTRGESEEEFFFDDDQSSVFDGLQERLSLALDSLRVDEEIGRGGMGVVYRAVQEKLDRTVAVKVLPPHPDLDSGFAKRFLTEARAMARLHHSHIVTIHDFGQTDCGLSYIVMEFVNGQSLDEIFAKRSLEAPRLVELMTEVAEALAYAHGLNVVHRDMKPQNILISARGRAKIGDFGIAKLEGDRHAARLTRTHQILGTPLYMAPEQTMGAKAVDHRADLYALGVMLYEGLTGTFPGIEVEAPSKLADIDLRLDPIILSLLEKDVARRANSAAVVARHCREIASSWGQGNKKRGLFGRMFGA
jgi:serine/threonine protein kinase